jgi:hypothetical protein
MHKKQANFGAAQKADKEVYHEAHQMAGNALARHVICMRVETNYLVPLTITKLTWPNMRPTRRPTTCNAKPGTGVEDTRYGNNATLEMKLKIKRHR